MRKRIIKGICAALVFGCLLGSQKADAATINKELVIVIDPGHGGNDAGATAKYAGKTIKEKTLNLKIANAMKKELLTYEGVKVYMTRSTDKTVNLNSRVKYATKKNADVIISLHNNAKGPASKKAQGAMVLVSRGTYRKDLAKVSSGAANEVLKELKKLGMKNNGLLKRTYPSKQKYANGTKLDYYKIIRDSVNAGIPGMIIEHGYVDNESDYKKIFSTDEDLEKLGIADATGIAKYFGLTKKDESVSYKAKGVKVKYLNKNWMAKGSDKYYVYNNGKYAKGWTKIGKTKYKFSKTGVYLKIKK